MSEADLENLKNISSYFRKLNGKIILLGLLRTAKLEYEQNNYPKCLETCKEILEKNPNNFVALRGLGCVMQSMGNDVEALKYYKQALKTSQNKEIEYTLIGTIYYNQNNFDEAVKYYNLAIDVNDNYEQAYDGRNQSILERHVQIIDLQDSLIKTGIF